MSTDLTTDHRNARNGGSGAQRIEPPVRGPEHRQSPGHQQQAGSSGPSRVLVVLALLVAGLALVGLALWG